MSRATRKAATLYIVLIALFFNTATSMAVSGTNVQSGDKVLLCTVQGFQWVSLDDADDSTQHAAQHCKICLFPVSDESASDYFFYSPQLAAFVNVVNTVLFDNPASLGLESFYSFAQGRAPPAFI